MDSIKELYNSSKDSQLFTLIISMYGVGLLTILLKDIPLKILLFIKRCITTSLTISSYNMSYYVLMNELLKGKYNNLRSIRLSNGRWGSEDLLKNIGIGSHILFYKRNILIATVNIEDSKTYEDKSNLTLTKFGRSHKIFNDLINTVSISDYTIIPDKTKIYKFSTDHWNHITSIPNRPIDSIILNKSKLDSLISNIDRFISMENFYKDMGIPYQLGILLSGPPGTGKTSLIKAIAGYYDKRIFTISPKDLYNLSEGMSDLKKNSILVIEDIDSNKIVHNRSTKDNASNNTLLDLDNIENSIGSLSDVLNSIDGIVSIHGRILIMTTNHLDKLDPALIRPGRIDIHIEMDYVDQECFNIFLSRFFNKATDNKFIGDNITVTTLQNEYLLGKDFDYFIERYCEKGDAK